MRRAAAGALVVAGVVCAAGTARAQTAGDMRRDLDGYYHGEQTSAYVIGGMGLAAAGGGAYLVTRKSDFARALGWTWIGMGGLETIGAAFYALQVDGEIDHYRAALARDPAAYRSEELDHMHGTSSRFTAYRATELGLVVAGAGMAIYGLVTKRDVWKGVGAGVVSLSLPLLVIDSVNNARANRYIDSVGRFQPSVAATPGGLRVALGGAF